MTLLFISSFFTIFLLGLQQQNVHHRLHLSSWMVSFFLAMAQVGFVKLTASPIPYWPAVLALWLGGASGASLSMLLHGHLVALISRAWQRNGVIGEVVRQ